MKMYVLIHRRVASCSIVSLLDGTTIPDHLISNVSYFNCSRQHQMSSSSELHAARCRIYC